MKNSIYTGTALASLLALCSFSSFANDSAGGSLIAIKEQEKVNLVAKPKVNSAGTSGVIDPLNTRLKAKMDKICSVTQKDLEERARKRREAEELRLAGTEKKSEREKRKKAELAEKRRRADEEKKQGDFRLAEERKQQKMNLNEERKRKAEEKKQRSLKLAEERKQQKMKLGEERKRQAEEKRKAEAGKLGEKGKRAEKENKKNEELAVRRKRVAEEAKQKLADQKKRKVEEVKQKKVKLAENRRRQAIEKRRAVEEARQRAEIRKLEASVNDDKNLESCDYPMTRDRLKITFGGGVHAQGYGKFSPSSDEYKYAHFMSGVKRHYETARGTVKGADVEFPQGVGNVGDYSDDLGATVDSMLRLRAEKQNEDLGILYGADVEFGVPFTGGKGVRGRGAHVFINSEYGDVRFGYQFGPETLMRVDATKIATVDGGADSGWFRKVNLEGKSATFPFHVAPRLYTEAFSTESTRSSFRLAGEYDKAIANTLPFRVAYYSPSYSGIRFGLSYSPGYNNSLFSVTEQHQKIKSLTVDGKLIESLKVGKKSKESSKAGEESKESSKAGEKSKESSKAGEESKESSKAGEKSKESSKAGEVSKDSSNNEIEIKVKGYKIGKEVRHVGADYGNILSAGVLYEYDSDQYKVKIGAVGEYGLPETPDAKKHNYFEYTEYNALKGVNLGVNADYKINDEQSARFAASFACLFHSGQPKDIKNLHDGHYVSIPEANVGPGMRTRAIKEQFGSDDSNTRYWTAGAGYKHENIYTSLTYFGSVVGDGDYLNDIALAVQYDLSPAESKSKFVPYLALHYFTTKEEGGADPTKTVADNQGALMLTGVKFSF